MMARQTIKDLVFNVLTPYYPEGIEKRMAVAHHVADALTLSQPPVVACVEGTVRGMYSEADSTNCLCCEGPHRFAVGLNVDVDSVLVDARYLTDQDGLATTDLSYPSWINDVLWKLDEGAVVRITVERVDEAIAVCENDHPRPIPAVATWHLTESQSAANITFVCASCAAEAVKQHLADDAWDAFELRPLTKSAA